MKVKYDKESKKQMTQSPEEETLLRENFGNGLMDTLIFNKWPET